MSGASGAGTEKKKRLRYYSAGIFLLLFLCGGIGFSLTPRAIRKIWLPAAASSMGITLKADEIRLESLFPVRLKAVNFHYADPETALTIRSGSSGLRIRELKRCRIELYDTRIEGLRIVCDPAAAQSSPAAPAPDPGPNANPPNGPDAADWTFAMEGFQVKDAEMIVRDQERKTVQIWSAASLRGDRFRTEEPCHISAEASLAAFPGRQNPLRIRKLPFRLEADYRLDGLFRLKKFSGSLETGVFDLSIADEIAIPAGAGISAAVRIEGSFPEAELLHIARSEITLRKDRKTIGQMQFQGQFGRTFQCSGTCSGIDLEPYLSILAPGSRVRMEVPGAEFHLTGSDFSAHGIRHDLKIRLIAGLKNLSIPIALNRQSRLMQLVLIPVEAMPQLVEMLGMKWSLQRHVGRCLDKVRSIISGQQNLNFDQAKMDLAVENGKLKISELTLTGSDIEMESIQGELDLGTEELALRTVLIVHGVKLPLKFNGNLNRPQPHFQDALREFVLLNAPLLRELEKVEKMLTEPISDKDTDLEKAIKRGYRDLNRILQ